jgi:hypothetical protein
MRLNAAQRIGAGDDDGAVSRVGVILEGDRLKPQHGRRQNLKTPRAQRRSGGLVVRLRTGDKNGHALSSRKQAFCRNGRLPCETPQCYRMRSKNPGFADKARAQIG